MFFVPCPQFPFHGRSLREASQSQYGPKFGPKPEWTKVIRDNMATVSVMPLLIGIACTEGCNLLQSINGRASADGEELIECCFDL